MDPSFARGSGQKSYLDLCSLTGKCLDADKHAAMCATAVFTGCLLGLSTAFSDGYFTLAPKPGRIDKVLSPMDEVRDQNKCTPAQAATLLGTCSYISTQLQGRVVKFAERAFIERRYSKRGVSHIHARQAR